MPLTLTGGVQTTLMDVSNTSVNVRVATASGTVDKKDNHFLQNIFTF